MWKPTDGGRPPTDRSNRGVRAAGGNAAVTNRHTTTELTPQEAQIARLARYGLCQRGHRESAVRQPNTVEYHLRKVYTKLGVVSRASLPQIL